MTAVRRYTEAIGEFIAADHLPDMLGCSLALADIQIAQGKLTDAKRTFDTGLRWTTEHPGLRGAADMHAGLSEVLIERNDLDAAARHLETSNELGESAGLPQHAYRWRVTMARLRRARGDLDGALELIEEAAPLYDTDFSPPVRPVAAIRARVQLAHGDLDSALEWATERGLTADDELSYVHEYEHITLTRVLIARHVAGHGTERARRCHQDAGPTPRGSREGLPDRKRDRGPAFCRRPPTRPATTPLPLSLRCDDALRRAAPEGHIRLFLHAGPAVTALLRSVASREHATPHARRVLAAVDLTAASGRAHTRHAPAADSSTNSAAANSTCCGCCAATSAAQRSLASCTCR